MLQITSDQRRQLRAQAHGLNPVVSISENGLTESVMKEIETSLNAHELIKIRVFGDSRENRDAFLQQICTELSAASVQQIGKVLVLYRPLSEEAKNNKTQNRRAAPRRTKRSYQG
ncbi:MAG: ribosome assembly RNA-binding protein YhbY [Pseudomonadota bacterium]|jgi:putative YhbY family RNA-binding protein